MIAGLRGDAGGHRPRASALTELRATCRLGKQLTGASTERTSTSAAAENSIEGSPG